MSISGKVKWFNPTKGFGFIARDDKEKDVFVHVSALKNSGMDRLNEGETLTFEVEQGPKGPNAVSLQKKS
tara:strand:- start:290 stop:499 length:210 start_codon:yes stop_codon:yes gene_type:complete